jgi:hypothetical protein
MEPGGIEPPTSCLQSSDEADVNEAGTPEKSGDCGDAGGVPD